MVLHNAAPRSLVLHHAIGPTCISQGQLQNPRFHTHTREAAPVSLILFWLESAPLHVRVRWGLSTAAWPQGAFPRIFVQGRGDIVADASGILWTAIASLEGELPDAPVPRSTPPPEGATPSADK